jgi:hypothetical protein
MDHRSRCLLLKTVKGMAIRAIMLIAALPGFANTFAAFGPQTYVRSTGAPVTVTNIFAVLNPNTQYTLRVHNGGLADSSTDFVSSTVITVNGVVVVAPNDLNQNVALVEKPVTLQASNQIAVQVRGAPGGSIAVEIIGVDNDPPVIHATASPAANAQGWNNSNVTVTFTCSDATSGVAVCPAPVIVSAEGASQVITGQAVDKAGNTATTSVTLSIDKTPPSISAAAAPLANAAGWNNSDVTVTFTCNDGTSGIATCPTPVVVNSDGANQAITGQAQDIAGNTASASVSINLDKTPPTIAAVVSPAPNAAGWNNTNPTVTFTCTDATSGVALCPSPQVVSVEGADQAVTGTVTDIAGNTASASVPIKLDKTPPVVAIASPPNGSTISLSTISIGLNGSESDSLSGVSTVTCNGTPAAISGPNFTCNVLLAQGANSISVRATDVAGNSSAAPLALTYLPAPQITITSPTNLSTTNFSPATVNGTISDPAATVTVNGIPAPQSGGSFSIPVPLVEGLNVLAVVATNAGGIASTATVQVTLDTTPPHITIESPADGAVTTEATATVTGLANDVVVGTVNAQDVQVAVNGIAAQVANRTYSAAAVPLALGRNTIQAVAHDRAGNGTTTSITVNRVLASQPPPPAIGAAVITQSLALLSGNNQTGGIGVQLPAPLIVRLTDPTSNPVTNQTVVFKVIGNDGTVSAGGSAPPSTAVMVNTDANGQAQVFWTLGHRSGAGINAVQVSSALAFGAANFTATGTTANAFQIVVDSGNDQTGVLGQPLGFPFVADVVDAGHNRVPNVPVTFTVKQGDGNLAGASTQTVNTDSNGRAIVVLTLGTQIGNANNLVEANFPNNPGVPAAFAASARAPGNPANTTVSGVVLDNSNNPIAGVTIRLFLTNQGNSNNLPVQVGAPVQTDAKGTFLIQPAPVGFFKLTADGGTATGPKSYPPLEYDIVTVAGNVNTVGMPIYLPALDMVNRICVDETHGGTLTLPQVPGFALTVLPGSATFPGGSRQGCVTVTPVNGDKVPMSPGFGQQPRFIVTIQPVGTKFDPPAPITLPNVDGHKPKAVTEMYSYDHDLGMFIAIGTGTVSDDGSVIASNPGVGVLKAGWHCGGDPAANGTVADCPTCRTCQNNVCVTDTAQQCKNCPLAGSKTGQCAGGTCMAGPAPSASIGIAPTQACSGTPTFSITKSATYTANNLNNISPPSCPPKTPDVRWTISDGTPGTSTSTSVSWTAPNNPANVSVKLEGKDLGGSFVQLDSKNVSVVIPSTDTSSLSSSGSCPAGQFGKQDLWSAVVKFDSCTVDFSGVTVNEVSPQLGITQNTCNFSIANTSGGATLTIGSSNKYSFDQLGACVGSDVTIPAGGCIFENQTQWQVGPNHLNYVIHTNRFTVPSGNSGTTPPGGFNNLTTLRTP